MNLQPIYKNLDTSFVNVAALIRYLRRRDFDGSVRIELTGYEADLTIKNGDMTTVETDTMTGRTSEGEDAFKRVLIRSKEPGGVINVFQFVEEASEAKAPVSAGLESIKLKGKAAPKPPAVEIVSETVAETLPSIENIVTTEEPEPKSSGNNILPGFPFELKNSFEERAKAAMSSKIDRDELLKYLTLIFMTLDSSLSTSGLKFQPAFEKLSGEVVSDYPFMDASAGKLTYANRKLHLADDVDQLMAVKAIFEVLSKMLYRLRSSSKYSAIHAMAISKLKVVAKEHEEGFAKVSLTPQVIRLIGS